MTPCDTSSPSLDQTAFQSRVEIIQGCASLHEGLCRCHTLGYPDFHIADYQLQIRDDLKAYDDPVQGRISLDGVRIPTRA
jgi:hypothetical protein